jgi:putative (di)nucleoside polyphosphate hydrolase
MPTKSPKKLRRNVCMLVANAQGKLFLGERLGRPGHWQFPQGGVEPGASLENNVLRELKEELGLRKKNIRSVTKLKARHWYLWKRIPTYAKGKWIGQSQTFWVVRFVGSNEDINVESAEDPEFRRWRWCSVSQVRKLAAKERLGGYEAALEEFVALMKQAK